MGEAACTQLQAEVACTFLHQLPRQGPSSQDHNLWLAPPCGTQSTRASPMYPAPHLTRKVPPPPPPSTKCTEFTLLDCQCHYLNRL